MTFIISVMHTNIMTAYILCFFIQEVSKVRKKMASSYSILLNDRLGHLEATLLNHWLQMRHMKVLILMKRMMYNHLMKKNIDLKEEEDNSLYQN